MNTSNPTQYKLPFSLLSTWKTHTRTRTHTLSLSLSLSLFSLFFLSFSLPLTLSLFLSFSLSLSLPLLDKQRQTVERYIQLPQQRKRSKPTVGDTCNMVHTQIQRQNPVRYLCTQGVIRKSWTLILLFVTCVPKKLIEFHELWFSCLLPVHPGGHLNSYTNFSFEYHDLFIVWKSRTLILLFVSCASKESFDFSHELFIWTSRTL